MLEVGGRTQEPHVAVYVPHEETRTEDDLTIMPRNKNSIIASANSHSRSSRAMSLMAPPWGHLERSHRCLMERWQREEGRMILDI